MVTMQPLDGKQMEEFRNGRNLIRFGVGFELTHDETTLLRTPCRDHVGSVLDAVEARPSVTSISVHLHIENTTNISAGGGWVPGGPPPACQRSIRPSELLM